MLLDNQASANIINNANLLTDIRKSQQTIVLNGVQNNASGVGWGGVMKCSMV